MGYSMNMFIIFLVVSLAMNLVNPSAWGSEFIKTITNPEGIIEINPETGQVDIGGLINKLVTAENISMLTLALITGVVAGLFLQDATYGIFAGFVVFMLGFALVPIGFFTDATIPFFIKLLIGVPMAFMYIFALIGWFRGSEL